ncbi:MAG: UDP-N-acetylglucosamine 2-epimerase (non-hydrolyzing) [Spirochaetes bacterium]|nr:UDP-N-acetylglucosamine 2-epimerase (non-hydrolyzing) [Spirochaetota bacterium]
MKKKKIISVIGARPQFIKAAPLTRKLRQVYTEKIIHTGQHYDRNMSDLFFKELKIPRPDYNLGVGSGTHGEQTGKMLIQIEGILLKEKPDLVIIYGDTNSTVAGALAAVKLHISVAHVEAGLRSHNRKMPEEHNRIVSDHVSDLLFVPSRIGMDNLKREGLSDKAYLVGDIMYDALLENIKIAGKRSQICRDHDVCINDYYLATVHRPANTDNAKNLKNILQALSSLDLKVIFPVHPRTKKFIKHHNLKWNTDKILMIDPIGYLDILNLTLHARRVLTDSGGLQKEAFYLKKEVVVLREESEWKELVQYGWTRLAGADRSKIVKFTVGNFKKKPFFYPYGKGDTSEKIIQVLRKFL